MKQIIHTLYLPGKPGRAFLSLHTAFEAAEASGARFWRISRIVLTLAGLLLVAGNAGAQERQDVKAPRLGEHYQPSGETRPVEHKRCVTTSEPGKAPVTRCGL